MNRTRMMGPAAGSLAVQWEGWRWNTQGVAPQVGGPAQVGAAIGPPSQVTGTVLRIPFGAEVRAGDWLNVAWTSLSGVPVPPSFADEGWEVVKAANAGGNCRWTVHRLQTLLDGAQEVAITSAGNQTQCGAGWWSRSHREPVLGVITEGATNQTADIIPGVDAALGGIRLTIGAARVNSTQDRATVVSGGTLLGTFPTTVINSALQNVLTADRAEVGPGIPVEFTWPPGGTRGGGGMTILYPDDITPGAFQL